MSNSLFLVEYEQTPDGKPIEETAHIIQSAFIDQRLLERLESDWGFNTTSILEEEGSEETIEIKHLDDKKIHEVYDYFFEAFKKLIIKANDRLQALAQENVLYHSGEQPQKPIRFQRCRAVQSFNQLNRNFKNKN